MLEIKKCIQSKTVPLRSIGLKPVDENMPQHFFGCLCLMCTGYQTNKVSAILDQRTLTINNKIAMRINNTASNWKGNYEWVIRHLVIPANKIICRGLDVFISQILFYKDGQAHDLFCSRQTEDPVIKRAHRQKLNNNFIQKIFGDRRRKYRELIKACLGKKKEVITQKKAMFGSKKEVKKQAKDAVVIKYKDGYEQLATQNQFLSMLLRRKQDSIWKQIDYIKNFISVQEPLKSIVVIKYNSDDIKYEELNKRAHKLMQVYGLSIQKGDSSYISEEEEVHFGKALMRQSHQIYSQYVVYKIACFISCFHDEKINSMTAKLIINEMGMVYLDNVYKLETEPLTKFDWTDEVYEKKMNEQEERIFFSKKIVVTEELAANAKKIEENMTDTYENLKEYYGLSVEEEDDHEEIVNNEAFKYIHPEIQEPISQILRNSQMTVAKFKKIYLKYKPPRKSIVRPFTCNLIESLHKVTKGFRRADPHEFVCEPKKSSSSHFSRSSCSWKRSYSSVNNNRTTAFATPREY